MKFISAYENSGTIIAQSIRVNLHHIMQNHSDDFKAVIHDFHFPRGAGSTTALTILIDDLIFMNRYLTVMYYDSPSGLHRSPIYKRFKGTPNFIGLSPQSCIKGCRFPGDILLVTDNLIVNEREGMSDFIKHNMVPSIAGTKNKIYNINVTSGG